MKSAKDSVIVDSLSNWQKTKLEEFCTMKVWITKYALTEGILVLDVEETLTTGGFVKTTSYPLRLFTKKECHSSKVEAIQRANEMREKKIVSLRKQIARLEKLSFSEEAKK